MGAELVLEIGHYFEIMTSHAFELESCYCLPKTKTLWVQTHFDFAVGEKNIFSTITFQNC